MINTIYLNKITKNIFNETGLIAGIELVGKINTVRTIWILYVSLFISMLVLNILSLSGKKLIYMQDV